MDQCLSFCLSVYCPSSAHPSPSLSCLSLSAPPPPLSLSLSFFHPPRSHHPAHAEAGRVSCTDSFTQKRGCIVVNPHREMNNAMMLPVAIEANRPRRQVVYCEPASLPPSLNRLENNIPQQPLQPNGRCFYYLVYQRVIGASCLCVWAQRKIA